MIFNKKNAHISNDQQLAEIINILFPPLTTTGNGEGQIIQVDYSADSNLEAALSDLEDGFNDETSRKTIRDIANRLYKVRKLLNVYQKINDKADAIVISNRDTQQEFDKINVAKDYDMGE